MAVLPPVSVVVTFYNQDKYVRGTLDAVLGQTYRPFEVIVVDDGSTDDTPRVCAGYGDRITYVRQANGGVSRARNLGMSRAHGTQIAFLDGDDLWEPEKLQRQAAAAMECPGAGLVAVDGTMFADDLAEGPAPPPGAIADTLYGTLLQRTLDRSDAPVVCSPIYDMLLDGKYSPISTPSQIMIPASVLREVGPWNVRFGVSADYELYLRIAARRPFAFVKQKLVRYRINPAGLSGDGFKRGFKWVEEKPAIFRSLATCERHRAARLIGELTRDVARAAYYRGARGERLWATRYLARYARLSRRPDLVLPYLGALWCPSSVRALTVATVRRLGMLWGSR